MPNTVVTIGSFKLDFDTCVDVVRDGVPQARFMTSGQDIIGVHSLFAIKQAGSREVEFVRAGPMLAADVLTLSIRNYWEENIPGALARHDPPHGFAYVETREGWPALSIDALHMSPWTWNKEPIKKVVWTGTLTRWESLLAAAAITNVRNRHRRAQAELKGMGDRIELRSELAEDA